MSTEFTRNFRTRDGEFAATKLLAWFAERLFLVFLLAFFVFPIVWVFLTSIKTRGAMQTFPPVWIFQPTLDAYVQLFTRSEFTINVLNSALIAGANTLFVLVISAPAAYSMARYETGGEPLLMYILALRFLPIMAIIPPLYIQMTFLGLVNTRIVLVLLHSIVNLPFAVWILRVGFQEIPEALFDASVMDGASELEIFYYVALPMTKPIVFAAGLITFIFSWNEFLFALVFTTGATTTAPVKVSALITGRQIFWNQIMAGAVILIVPLMALVYVGHEYIVSGITFGAGEE